MLLTLVKIFQDNVVLRATWAGNAFGVSKAPPLVGGRPGGSQPISTKLGPPRNVMIHLFAEVAQLCN